MAEIKWTDSQLDAIERRKCNILVSAAAGSGKTTVLVERVLRLLSDEENPVDLGSLVIMTFTKAAASSMKEKIYKELRKAIQKDPLNENLRRQMHEVHNARICTIDSLCMEIVKENFHVVDVDPGFRIADQSEEEILKVDILKELIEDKYKEPTDSFLELVNFYIEKSDSKLESLIMTFFDYAQSYPEPDRWISNSIAAYTEAKTNYADSTDEQIGWLYNIAKEIEDEVNSIREMADLGLRISNMNYGPEKYVPVFEYVLAFVDEFTGEDKTFDYRREVICAAVGNWPDKPRIKKDEVETKLKDLCFALIDDLKKKITGLKEKYFQQDLCSAFKDIGACSNVAVELAELTKEFSSRYKLAKWERNIADFNDVAHYALQVLIEHDEEGNIVYDVNGEPCYTKVADQMAKEIKEIVVDEYQDTNMLQEYIIGALSAKRFGRPDVFMVGDVKQSIYGFRKACPQLFIDKYNSYATDGLQERKILLNSNYRSRKEVLEFTNYIFNQAMIKEVGTIDYTDGHALVCGAKYPEPEFEGQFNPEIVSINAHGKEGKLAEALVVANRIQELIENGKVTDSETRELRNIRYSDIAILSRNADNIELEQMLEAKQIPVIKASNKGFFSCFEIRLIMNLFKIIDNPFQDIPFTAVITSPLLNLEGNELAKIKADYKAKPFSMYLATRAYAETSENKEISRFLEKLENYREENTRLGICALFDYVIENSDILSVVESMPQGQGRKANIDMLRAIAVQYSKSSFTGLFNFLRFVKQVQDTDTDYGQAQVFAGGMNAVQMMTIHKSKGLEFPVVFLVNADKGYNEQDLTKSIVLDRELGMGIEFRDPATRLKKHNLVQESIISAKRRENCAEEMRLLYVALTRAKEKIIITSRGMGLDSSISNWVRELYNNNVQISSGNILKAKSYLKIMGETLVRHPDFYPFFERAGFEVKDVKEPFENGNAFQAKVLELEDVEEERVGEIFDRLEFLYDIDKMIEEYSGRDCEEVRKQLEYSYPFEEATKMDIKRTASSLEVHQKPVAEDKPGEKKLFRYEDDETGLRGAERGNAYHRFFELLDYGMVEEGNMSDAVTVMLKNFVEKGTMTQEYADAIEISKIETFLNTDIGKRMKAASDKGTLVREQQFVMSVENNGEQQLIQGIIDAFLEEDGKIVLVDYKTDKNKTSEEFIVTYENQLNAYADALQRATGKIVVEKVIYSLELGTAISF